MSRFREEYYNTKAHKAWEKSQSQDARDPRVVERAKATSRAAIRAEHFRKSRAGHHKSTAAAQIRMF